MARLWIAALAATSCLAAVPALASEGNSLRCASYGPGFVYSETSGFCVRISGSIEAGFVTNSGGSSVGNKAGLSFDARKDTEMGPFRVYVAPKAGTFN